MNRERPSFGTGPAGGSKLEERLQNAWDAEFREETARPIRPLEDIDAFALRVLGEFTDPVVQELARDTLALTDEVRKLRVA